jgi:hypothetical protein
MVESTSSWTEPGQMGKSAHPSEQRQVWHDL